MQTNAGASPSQQPSRKRGCLFGSLIIGGLVLLGLIAAPNPKPTTTSKAASSNAVAPATTAWAVTATELWKAYQANEAAAQQKYGGRALAVSGTVAGVDLDFSDDPVVKLSTPNEFMAVQADLTDETKPKAASLSKGQRITLQCEGVGEVVGTPMLKACTF